MSATLRLDRFQLMWLAEGAIGKSHLRWDIYPMMVNDVYPQLNDNEREFIFTYLKRDESWKFAKEKNDDTAKQYFLQMLARYNPANHYRVTMKEGRKKAVVADDAYLWDGKYYVGWQRYCAPEMIKKVEQKPYKKCTNRFCVAKSICLRNTEYKEGDELMADNRDWACDKCDFLIVGADVLDLIAEMIITKNNESK